jgi:hypothetical protein
MLSAAQSKWGANDQRGSGNHMKPESVLRAVKLIRTGEIIELGRVLRTDMPFSVGRRFEMHTKRTTMNTGSNRRGSNEEIMFTEMGQVGTQFDGFTHQTIGDSLYNCVKMDDVATRGGFTKLGIENVGSLITRGVLIDVAALKGVEMLPATYPITVADLQAALQRQKIALQPGDAVIVNSGWGPVVGHRRERYLKTNPGLTTAAAEWLAKPGPHAHRYGQRSRERHARPRSESEQPGASNRARREWHSSAREPEARRAGRQAGV